MNALAIGLTSLVLLNLAFVQITGAVGMQWMLPMYLLTFATPLGCRWRDTLLWRGLWNTAVLAVFAMMVRDTLTSGPRHLLEDGLTLAAFCQVHLLNGIRRDQRPDLLFFNSFLIALVTAFFCQDLIYSLIFVCYAATLLITMTMNSATDRDGRLPPELASRIIRSGFRRVIPVLTITALVFAFWPRDFHRQGWLDDDSWFERLAGSHTEFSDEVRLDRSALATLDTRVVMRIALLDGEELEMPRHWRGAALAGYDHLGWRPQSGVSLDLDDTWQSSINNVERRVWERPASGPSLGRARVTIRRGVPERLFAPLGAHQLQLGRLIPAESVLPASDGTLRVYGGRGSVEGADYEVTWVADRSRAWQRRQAPDLRPLLQLDRNDPRCVPPEIRALVDEAHQGLNPMADQLAVANHCVELLRSRFEYRLPGEPGAAIDLQSFLSSAEGGHCELFATALAVMLRLQDIPCRLATGYLVDEWDESGSEFVVRNSHAHAWVEIWDGEARCFRTLDATPAADGTEQVGGEGPFAAWTASLRKLWNRITRFGSDDRAALLDWLRALPSRLIERPLSLLALLTIAVASWLLWRRRRHARVAAPVRAYQRALRRAGFAQRQGETPRELLERARTQTAPERLRELELATAEHERERFGQLGS